MYMILYVVENYLITPILSSKTRARGRESTLPYMCQEQIKSHKSGSSHLK